MTRPLQDWADRKYAPGTAVAHAVPFGDLHTLCGEESSGFYGTGTFDEGERALSLPLCGKCASRVEVLTKPANEFTAPGPLYAPAGGQ